MSKVLGNLEPKLVFGFFEDITQHPHPSKKETKLANFLVDWAKEMNFECERDKIGNICIRKPATPGMENRKGIIIQGHIDMVCVTAPGVKFDFDNDPIQLLIDGDWVKANGTTLGADNGIGVAMGMALLASNDIPHPALELLCTLDEETGLTGASYLGTDLLKGDILINIDSEIEGTFTIGCAGGVNTTASFRYEEDAVPPNTVCCEVGIFNLQGGHSGIEIHDGRANAIKILNRFLWNATKKFDIRLSSLRAGVAHNAIPAEAYATITVPSSQTEEFHTFFNNFQEMVKSEWKTKEPKLEMSAIKQELPSRVMTKCFQKRLLRTIYASPHGPLRYSPDVKGLVQSSTNLAQIETRCSDVFIITSQRSSVESEKPNIVDKVRATFELGGAIVTSEGGYPAWQPNIDSPVLKLAVKLYKDLFGKEPNIEIIHAGLECGLVGDKYPAMDMLSFGPNLRDVHSPAERMDIPSVGKCWTLLKEIAKNVPVK